MKTCTVCTTLKPLGKYYKQSKSHDGVQSRCKDCSKESQKKYRVSSRGRSRTGRRVMWNKIFKEKGGRFCMRCGITHLAPIFDLHHRNPEEKEFSVGRGVKNWEAVKKEITKCDLLCANCHRIIHWEETQKRLDKEEIE